MICLCGPNHFIFLKGVCITASGNILTSGNNSLKLFMAPLETIKLLTSRYLVTEGHFAQL